MTTVREIYEALGEFLEDNAGDEVFLASQPSWPMQNHIAGVRRIEFVEDHPFEGRYGDPCETCGAPAEGDDHQMVTRIYVVEGDQVYDEPYLPGEAKEELGW